MRNCSGSNGLEGTVPRQGKQNRGDLQVTLWSPSGSGSVSHAAVSDSLRPHGP